MLELKASTSVRYSIKKNTTISRWPLYVWFLFSVLFPFYVFSSGMPQPSDSLLVILILSGLINYWLVRGNLFKEIIKTLLYLVIYIILVNSIWAFFINQSLERPFPSYFHSLFYVYNFFVFRMALILYQRYSIGFLYFTGYGVGFSMILQSSLAIATDALTSRTSLFFNNPNQLGYYALLAGSILVVIASQVRINVVFQIVAYFAFFFLCLISSSKAALAGSLILASLALFNQGLLNAKQFLVLLIAMAAGYYFITTNYLGKELFTYSYDRFQTIGESRDDSIEGRGYDRILNNPGYMILGAGEGGYYRFDTLLKAAEIHSSFGTILFCYGVIGFFLFIRFLTKIFKGGTIFNLLYAVPIFVYSITHQGLRSTLFWIFLAIIFILNFEHRTVKIRNTSKNNPIRRKRTYVTH